MLMASNNQSYCEILFIIKIAIIVIINFIFISNVAIIIKLNPRLKKKKKLIYHYVT